MKTLFQHIARLAVAIIRWCAFKILLAFPCAPEKPVNKPSEIVSNDDKSKFFAAFKVANGADWNWKAILEGLSEAASGLDFDNPEEREVLDKIYLASDMSRQLEKSLATQAVMLCEIYRDIRRLRSAKQISDGRITASEATPGSTRTPTSDAEPGQFSGGN